MTLEIHSPLRCPLALSVQVRSIAPRSFPSVRTDLSNATKQDESLVAQGLWEKHVIFPFFSFFFFVITRNLGTCAGAWHLVYHFGLTQNTDRRYWMWTFLFGSFNIFQATLMLIILRHGSWFAEWDIYRVCPSASGLDTERSGEWELGDIKHLLWQRFHAAHTTACQAR